ncbi:MAG TPA: hypothetical protein VIG75_13270 [Citricoccus sp.]
MDFVEQLEQTLLLLAAGFGSTGTLALGSVLSAYGWIQSGLNNSRSALVALVMGLLVFVAGVAGLAWTIF